jgi:hypothetical protein
LACSGREKAGPAQRRIKSFSIDQIMRTAREDLSEFQLQATGGDPWAVTVVYEDTGARERALRLCHHLVQGFKTEIEFVFNWWRFRYLEDPDIAQAAAQTAAQADILLFSTSSHEELPEDVRNWTELWVPLRTPGEGVLLVLTGDAEGTELPTSPLFRFLRNLARKASMDCLPRDSDEPWTLPSTGVRNIQNRAVQGTRILDDILRRTPPVPTPPSHWGINE